MQPFELFVGLRYTRGNKHAERRNRFVSFISLIAIFSIGLGVAALITVMSVMNGFQKDIRTHILGVASHIQISGFDAPLKDWEAVANQAAKHKQVKGSAPYVMAQGMLANESQVQGVLVRGILPDRENQVAEFGSKMKAGSLDNLRAGEFGMVLGRDLARNLGVRMGDKVTLIAPQGNITPAGIVPRLKQFRVVGIFEVGMLEYDNGLALIQLSDAQALYRIDGVSGVRLKLEDMLTAPQTARELSQSFTAEVYITNWTQSHANLFRAVQIEKNVMFIILTLIIAVAAFNIVSTLVMAVNDKKADIAILRTLGTSPLSIMKIFMVQGSIIGIIGMLGGVLLGVLLATNIDVIVPAIENTFSVKFMPKDVYQIGDVPSDVQWVDVFYVASVSLIWSFLATLYPSWRASRVNPAEALRYE